MNVWQRASIGVDALGGDMPLRKYIIVSDYKSTITVSYDETLGIQTIANTPYYLRPDIENGGVYRDSEYKRIETVSLRAGIDLLIGESIFCKRLT